MTTQELQQLGWIKVAVSENYFVMANDMVDYRWNELAYDIEKQKLQILSAYQHPTGFKTRETIYNGKCPDVETFKNLLKLLEIHDIR